MKVRRFIPARRRRKSREREKVKLEEERLSLREEKRNLAAIARLRGNDVLAGTRDRADLLDFLGGVWRMLRD